MTVPAMSQVNRTAVTKRIYKEYKYDMRIKGYKLSRHDKDSLYIKAIKRVEFAIDSLKTLYSTFDWPHLKCGQNIHQSQPLPSPHYFGVQPRPVIMYRKAYPFDRVIIR